MAIAALAVQAAPTNLRGDAPAAPSGRDALADSPAEQAYRAGIQAHLNGRSDEAKQHLERALKHNARHVPAMVALAAVAQSQGQAGAVEEWLTRARQAGPKAPEVALAWGRWHVAGGRAADAERDLLKAIELAPLALPARLELGDLYLRVPRRQPDALRMFRDAVRIAPDNAHAQQGLGVALAAGGQRAEALAALTRATQLSPALVTAQRTLGRLHLEAGAADKALGAFDAGLAAQKYFVPLMLDRAEALSRLGRHDEADAQMVAAAQAAPKAFEVALRHADLLQLARRWDAAQTQYQRAIALDPKHALPYNNLAWMTLQRQGDAKQAVTWARQAVALSPNSSPLHDTLGWALRAAGDLPSAQASLERAISLEPRVAAYHLHLATVLAERGEGHRAAARGAAQRAIEIQASGETADAARALLRKLPPG